ncbi:MAG: PEP/pyruvate-binding domain-containing protein [Syntrophomonas sp.]|nr:PEP/pyruvate-binding domain-containing protein [Syntrophomonadaceae bacterium]
MEPGPTSAVWFQGSRWGRPWQDIILINANFGLGESMVSGAIEPDQYCLDYWFDITEKRIGRKQGKTITRDEGGTDFIHLPGLTEKLVLSDEQIYQLGLIIIPS